MSNLGIRIAVGQVTELTDEILEYAAQLGTAGIQPFPPGLPSHPDPTRLYWEYEDLVALRRRCEAHGLRLEAVAMHIYPHAMLGLPGAEGQLELCRRTVRNMGRAGIPILGHDWAPTSVWRTTLTAPGRGGAAATAFDMAEVEAAGPLSARELTARFAWNDDPVIADALGMLGARRVGDEEMWANYERFIRAVGPDAEDAGVTLAVHPDDPPLPSLAGVARIFRSPAGFRRGLTVADSPSWAVLLCLGSTSEMEGGAANVDEMIETFGPLGRISYVHFRDVQGWGRRFQEVFIGEGNYDPARALRALKRVGFGGFLMDDHVPAMVADSPYGHRARAHAIGYMQGLLAMLDQDDGPAPRPD